MKRSIFGGIFILVLVAGFTAKTPGISNKWQALPTLDEKGILGERTDLWRNNRLWFVFNSNFLLSGFEKPPGEHLWQGEHVGKWLHAATLDYEATKDPRLKQALDITVERLLKTQSANGYIGTYSSETRFYNTPADKTGWDIWTQRYNLYGLLTYEKFHPDERIVTACKKNVDLLIEIFGEGKNDITKYGTRQGLSSTTLLESIVMLYERTQEKKYLQFAEQIVSWSEENPKVRLMDAMLKNESVVKPGDGKAYQLMANLLGYFRLYKSTNNSKYLETVLNAWEQIQKNHILVTGGPWTRQTAYNANKECFAETDAFDPWEIVVENCCTVTWVQLNIELSELTGLAKYADEAEKTMFNQFFGGQHSEGIDWCYYTKPNQTTPPYVPKIHCCASSGPRALEVFYRHLAGSINGILSINSFSPSRIALSGQYGGGYLDVTGNFPFTGTTVFHLQPEQEKTFAIEFRLPDGTSLREVKINGRKQKAEKNDRGYFQISNTWKKGDKVSVDVDYRLKAHIQSGENGKKWVAFTYGPLALAEKISLTPSSEPFKNMTMSQGQPAKILNMVSLRTNTDSTLVFQVKNSGIQLIPYFQAGSRESGPRTYFEIGR